MTWRPLIPCDRRALDAALVALGVPQPPRDCEEAPVMGQSGGVAPSYEKRVAAGGVAATLPAPGVVVPGRVA